MIKIFQKLFHFPGETQSRKNISKLEEECIPRHWVPNMQNECVKIRSDTRQPHRMGPVAQSRNYTRALREYGCECDLPHIPPCVPQPGIPAQTHRSAPCQLDERWKNPHKSVPVYMNRANIVQRRAYRSAHPEQVVCFDPLTNTLSRCHRTESHPLARSRGFVALGELAGGFDSQERHVA